MVLIILLIHLKVGRGNRDSTLSSFSPSLTDDTPAIGNRDSTLSSSPNAGWIDYFLRYEIFPFSCPMNKRINPNSPPTKKQNWINLDYH